MIGTTFGSLPVAVAFAYTLRVPMPLGATIGPLGDMGSYGVAVFDVLNIVFLAWLFYGITGGFVLLSVVGALAGVTVGRKYSVSARKSRAIVFWAGAASILPVFVMAFFGYVVGPR